MSSLIFTLTDEHAAACHGIPILVHQDTGDVFGPLDCMPWGEPAARWVQRVWEDAEEVPDEVTRFLSAAGLTVG